jgi:hypothetical protein
MSLPDFSTHLKKIDNTRNTYYFTINKATVTSSYNLPKFLFDACNDATYIIPKSSIKTIKYLFTEASRYSGDGRFLQYDTAVRDDLKLIGYEILYRAIGLMTDYHRYHSTLLIDRYVLRRCIMYQLITDYVGRGTIRRLSHIDKMSFESDSNRYQNNFWLERIIRNEEECQEIKINKLKNYIADDQEGFNVIDLVDRDYTAQFKVIFYYTTPKYEKPKKEETFEDSFIDDIPEKHVRIYLVNHWHIEDALRLAFNQFCYDIIGNDNWLAFPFSDFKYSIQLLFDETLITNPRILLDK